MSFLTSFRSEQRNIQNKILFNVVMDSIFIKVNSLQYYLSTASWVHFLHAYVVIGISIKCDTYKFLPSVE